MNPLAYFPFVARFAVNPWAALMPHQGRHTIDPSLAVFALIGAALGTAILAGSRRAGILDPRGLKQWCGPFLPRVITGRWSWIAWPAATAAAIVFITAFVHGFAVLWLWSRTTLGFEIWDETLGGAWQDTANALLAASTFLAPLFAIVVTTGQQIEERYEMALTLPLVLAIFAYPIAALSATHPDTGFWEAAGALMAPIGVPVFFLVVIGGILQTLSRFLKNIRRQR